MKSAALVLVALLSARTYAQKPVALISGNGNVSIASNKTDGGLSQTTVSKHDQTMEMAQDFLQFCSTVAITLDQATTPDYFVLLNRKGSPSLFGEIGQSQIMVLNRTKAVMFVAKKGTLKNAVKQACNTITSDWQANGSLATPSASTELPPAASVAVKPAPNSATTVAVIVEPTASAQKYCKPETIAAVLSDSNAYLKSKGMTIGTTANSSRAVVLIVNRPMSKWIEITVQERDHAGNVLWSEKVSSGAWDRSGTAGILNTLEKVHKILDAKIPESRASNAEAK
jgi:hypothetical protein